MTFLTQKEERSFHDRRKIDKDEKNPVIKNLTITFF